MTTTFSEVSDRHRVAVVAVAVLILLVISTPLVLWFRASRSSAAFADAEVLETNHLGAGTLDLEVGAKTITFEALNLAPGDTVSGQLELVNAGSFPIIIDIFGQTDGDLLASWLRFDVWRNTSTCRPGDTGPRISSNVVLTTLPNALISPEQSLAATNTKLPVGTSAIFCLGAHLLLEAPNEVQGRRTTIDLTVNATHDVKDEVEQ